MSPSRIFLAVLLLALQTYIVLADQVNQAKVQGKAIKAWANSLSDIDYNATHWAITMHQQPANFFEHYVEQLSDLFDVKKALVNFVMVGACDGTHDRTIRDRFLPSNHWRGVFVEPFEINHRDLVAFMDSHGAKDRATVLRAAATLRCNETTIKMKRPTFEEKNKSLPHWMRREIGSIVPFDKLDRPASGGWIFEYVPCVNGQKILQNWTYALGLAEPGDSESRVRLRPHVLKVDVEGHDYEVLMGFLHDGIPNAALPLLISFEAKSILKHFDSLRAHLQNRGYAVSHLATDGFALLKAEHIFAGMSSTQRAQAEEGLGESTTSEQKSSGGSSGRRKRRNKRNKKSAAAEEEDSSGAEGDAEVDGGDAGGEGRGGGRRRKRKNRKGKRRSAD